MKSELLVIFGIMMLLAILIAQSAKSSLAWETFREGHHCKAITELAPPAGWTRGPPDLSGEAAGSNWTVTVAPNKTGYRCDDEAIFWH